MSRRPTDGELDFKVVGREVELEDRKCVSTKDEREKQPRNSVVSCSSCVEVFYRWRVGFHCGWTRSGVKRISSVSVRKMSERNGLERGVVSWSSLLAYVLQMACWIPLRLSERWSFRGT